MSKHLTGEQITRHIQWLSDILHQSCRERAAVGCAYSDNLASAEAYDSLLLAIRHDPERVASVKVTRSDRTCTASVTGTRRAKTRSG